MIIPYYELGVKKYKTYFWMSYCLLQSCPEYTDPTVGLVKPLVGWNMMRIVAMTSNTVTIQIKDYLLQRYREG